MEAPPGHRGRGEHKAPPISRETECHGGEGGKGAVTSGGELLRGHPIVTYTRKDIGVGTLEKDNNNIDYRSEHVW